MKTHTQTTVFDRVVCGVDASVAGATAARAAARITSPDGSLALVTANDTSVAVHAGWDMAQILEELAIEAQAGLERGRIEAGPLHAFEAQLVDGDPLQSLLAEIVRREATLVVVGSHDLPLATGIVLGAVSTHLLHEAPCSILIARRPVDPERWPQRIVVGVDGSADSALAVDAGNALAQRCDAQLRKVVATRDARVDLEAVSRIAPGCEVHDTRALELLDAASESADLIVVGSRGRRGVRALGSLSDRVAHEAACSVLVVRRPG